MGLGYVKNLTVEAALSILDALAEPVSVMDENLKVIYCNEAFGKLVGLPPEKVLGRHCYELIPGKHCHTEDCTANRVKEAGAFTTEVEKHIVNQDRIIPTMIVATPLKDVNGKVVATVEAITDLSELRSLRERDDVIRKLSSPIVEVWEGIIMLPLIGILGSARAKQITDSILRHVAQFKTKVVLLDISGIMAIDTKTASHILRAVQAVRLMGSEVVITGIRPDVAATLAALGVDLSGFITRSSLREGLQYSFDKLVLSVVKSSAVQSL
jgi:rsbT co-antagonist protein RsbR